MTTATTPHPNAGSRCPADVDPNEAIDYIQTGRAKSLRSIVPNMGEIPSLRMKQITRSDKEMADAVAVARAAGSEARGVYDRRRNPKLPLEEAGQKAWSKWVNESENTRYGSINFDAFRDGFGLPRFGH